MAKDYTERAPDAEMRSPAEWARAKGQWVEFRGSVDPELGNGSHYTWQHAAASTLHGWDAHAYHEGAPLLLTERDYLAALDAAAPAKGLPKLHKPAASERHALKD